MPKCICGKEEPILYSYMVPEISVSTGTALCKECLQKRVSKDGEKSVKTS